MSNNSKEVHIILDMDNTLLSMECLDTVIETALSAQLHPDAIADAMVQVHKEMDKGMNGKAKLTETIPARIAIAKRLGAPVKQEHFEIVSRIVPNTFTQAIVGAIKNASASTPIRISIVSGGPQICVNQAVTGLREQIRVKNVNEVEIDGHGSKMVMKDNGDLDQLKSEIRNSKVETVQQFVKDPSRAIMLGDSLVDLEVFDASAVHYFIAIGLWVKRESLFDRVNNPPYFLKVSERSDLISALETVIHAARE